MTYCKRFDNSCYHHQCIATEKALKRPSTMPTASLLRKAPNQTIYQADQNESLKIGIWWSNFIIWALN